MKVTIDNEHDCKDCKKTDEDSDDDIDENDENDKENEHESSKKPKQIDLKYLVFVYICSWIMFAIYEQLIGGLLFEGGLID